MKYKTRASRNSKRVLRASRLEALLSRGSRDREQLLARDLGDPRLAKATLAERVWIQLQFTLGLDAFSRIIRFQSLNEPREGGEQGAALAGGVDLGDACARGSCG